jgi:hypothetical protein
MNMRRIIFFAAIFPVAAEPNTFTVFATLEWPGKRITAQTLSHLL